MPVSVLMCRRLRQTLQRLNLSKLNDTVVADGSGHALGAAEITTKATLRVGGTADAVVVGAAAGVGVEEWLKMALQLYTLFGTLI